MPDLSLRNYFAEGEEILRFLRESGEHPAMLLHSCCAPCSSHVISALREFFALTVYYYNPNIAPEEEYRKRKAEQIRFLREVGIPYLEAPYEGEKFVAAVRGLENEPERGARCPVCFALRLEKTARIAKENGFPYFCTTLTVSPHKDARILNEIGEKTGKEVGIRFFPSDFKKKDGYLHSIRLSEEYKLYRQDYCGCVFSRKNPGEKEK